MTLLGCATAAVVPEPSGASASAEAALAEASGPNMEQAGVAYGCSGGDTSTAWFAGAITYAVEGEPDSTILWRGVSGHDDERGAFLEAEFTVRAVAGYAQGTEHYRCVPSGLALEAVHATDGSVTFEPPLVVLPVTALGSATGQGPGDGGVGVRAGVAWLSDTGSEPRRYDARHAWEVEEIAPHGPLGSLFERHVRVRSVLLLDGEGGAYEVETETDWGLGPDRGAVLGRRQVVRADGVVHTTRAEQARTLTP